MERIKNIEFLRIVGCLAIILLHLFNNNGLHGIFSYTWLYNDFYYNTWNGQKAVDLFFIISGLFFSLKLALSAPPPTIDFIKKKVLRLWPVLIFTIIIYALLSFTGAIEFTFYDNILAVLGLNGTPLVLEMGNTGVFWYVSAMLWTMALFYYLLLNFNKQKVNLFIALLVTISYGILIQAKNGHINNHEETFYYIFNVGMMRAFGGIGIGYFIGEWYKNNKDKINNIKITLTNKYIISAFEFGCVYFIIKYLMLDKLKYNNHIIFIVVFTMTIILFLINKGFISKALNNNFCTFLSKYTYSFYMTHQIIIKYLKGSIWKHQPWLVFEHPIMNIVITLTAIFILGIITYHFVEKPTNDYITKKLLK